MAAQSNEPATKFACICGKSFDTDKKRNQHAAECEALTSMHGQKRKADTGYHEGAFVPLHTSQTKFRHRIRLRNRMLNDRAVSRSSALHSEHTIAQLGSINVQAEKQLGSINVQAEKQVIDEEEVMFDSNNEMLEDDDPDLTAIDVDADSVASKDMPESEGEDEDDIISDVA